VPDVVSSDPAAAEGSYTAEQVSARSGVSVDDAQRLWRALGFPEAGNEPVFTDADIEALATVDKVVRDGVIDTDLAVTLARALGQTMARLSDWEVAALLHKVEEMDTGDIPPATVLSTALSIADDFQKAFEELMVYAWRRHLAAAVARVEASHAAENELLTTRVSVGFADIVSFTALSNQLSQDRIGDLVELFESRCADVVALQRGRVIKSLGDSVLFVNHDPIAAYDTAEGIINVIGRDPRMPDVRVGLATGSVVLRLGDVFGPPVNMAARLTAVARRNRVIIDHTTAALLPEDQFETRRLPARPVRGFGLVEPVAVRRH
jgi:adenylate cyclase